MSEDHTIKGLSPFGTQYNGSNLRIAIVHTRWNKVVIDALLVATLRKLREAGVKEGNIVIQSVPGSFELPLACARVISASQIQAYSTATDLLSGANSLLSLDSRPNTPAIASSKPANIPSRPFDAVIAIGVLLKGSTMHFEHISEAVSTGLMRVQLDSGVPIIFGVLTALADVQALIRAGIGGRDGKQGHNHGEDWGAAVVEMGSQARRWAQGKFA
ncbi:putative 6,7-dimethyl-8-ribityllumazine synthase [Cantharellus anzutake]|uniref:putative 6,7-dimethyl-8-ribityllumazine synthase n=1 Tax=Cantharellus anzutake TaxID=1750568 RepID=UPI0019086425|nr:putative 6,7-dimethyl-8-ribityllumazine synthase [Cantharellus anzutake]KAF8322850.1 putative 6,7-dimethyl-8-ribityllumazine synthase [Cantharellus anzutake]